MAINKVDLIDGTVLVDMTDATATADKIVSGYTAYGADGTKLTGNIANKTSTDLTASGATVTAPAGYYSSQVTKSVASGTEGTPTATKGTVSNHSVSVTPSVTNTAGYINGGTKTGTAVTVSANELVSGTKMIEGNGNNIDVTNYASVNVAVQPSLETLTVTPTESQQVFDVSGGNADGYSPVTVNAISNTYVGSGIPRNNNSNISISYRPNFIDPEGVVVLNAYFGTTGKILSNSTDKTIVVELYPNTNYGYIFRRVAKSSTETSRIALFEDLPEINDTGRYVGDTDTPEEMVLFTTGNTERYAAIYIGNTGRTYIEETIAGSFLTVVNRGPEIVEWQNVIAFAEAGYYENDISTSMYIEVAPDWTEATAEAEDVLHGKTFYGSDGSLTTGIATSVTGRIYQDEDGYIVLDDDGSYKGDRWTRPSEWMPYAKGWSKSSFEGIYYVYDLALNVDEDNPAFWALYMDTTSSDGRATIETGYVNPSGVFLSETSESWITGTVKEGLLPYWDEVNDYERYFVIRVTPQDGYHLSLVNFNSPSASLFSELYGTITIDSTVTSVQPCIEQYGRLPYTIRISQNYSYRCNYAFSMKHSYLVDIGKGGRLTNLESSFRYSYNLECVEGLETWDVSNVTSVSYMFGNCHALIDVRGIGSWNLTSATNLSYMFVDCYKLISIDGFQNKHLELVTNIRNMFSSCFSLTRLDFSGVVFSSALVNMNSFVQNCRALEDIDMTNWSISPTDISYAFQNCHVLKNIDLSGWSLTNVTTMRSMFQSCYTLNNITWRNSTSSALTSLQDFINSAHKIRELDFTGWDFSSVTNANGFQTMRTLTSLKGLSVPVSFNISGNTMLNTNALVEILTALPIVTTTQTITLGSTLKGRLSAEQLAIATGKGWTVA